ncbi:Carbohydrate binding module 27 [Anaeromicropila populeti]|uniref:Carbohydrate binding module 27 n=1 Tax=Anaeromicropila populeti TaxID=37658 RepID=A0A1I6KY92_9FIRM|nr:Carbohydrate binding module 27 [Anaeromicropila populeti]
MKQMKKHLRKKAGIVVLLLTGIIIISIVWMGFLKSEPMKENQDTQVADVTELTNVTENEKIQQLWDFSKCCGNWYYGGSDWEYQYSGGEAASVSVEQEMLKVSVDYSGEKENSWSQLAVCEWDSEGMNLIGANTLRLDFLFDTASMSGGGFLIKVYSNHAEIDANAAVDMEHTETVSGTLKKAKVEVTFDEITNAAVKDLNICIVGNLTDYKGDLWLDNITLLQEKGKAANDIYVSSTLSVTGSTVQADIVAGQLITFDETGEDVIIPLSTKVEMTDKAATDEARQIYSYLQAVGNSPAVIFGQQGNTHHKAGASMLSYSDTYDITGSYAGVIGMDALSLVGNEYSASRYNRELAAALDAEPLPQTAAGNVQAAAALTNYNIEAGAIITLSAHMPNFSLVKESGNYDGEHSYSRYDFSGYTPNTVTGDVMNQILPGGKYHDEFTAYLDMIADYAKQVKGTILFRPFHENTGSWFWWGADFCSTEVYQNVFRYTVEYFRDIKEVHNFIYVYGPSCEAASTEEYAERYPGDEYVDMVGFDMYNINPSNDDTWFRDFEKEVTIVQEFARQHNKLFAITETGAATSSPDAGDNQTALHRSGNEQLDWYQNMMSVAAASDASYFLVWANFSERDGFYTPYVKAVNEDGSLYGHEMLDYFIDFFNYPNSMFAVNQKAALVKLKDISVSAVSSKS